MGGGLVVGMAFLFNTTSVGFERGEINGKIKFM